MAKRENAVRAQVLARDTGNAYSTFRYRNWPAVAEALLDRGLTEQEAEAVLRSKWMRWAADASPARYGNVPVKAILQFLDGLKNERQEIEELIHEVEEQERAS